MYLLILSMIVNASERNLKMSEKQKSPNWEKIEKQDEKLSLQDRVSKALGDKLYDGFPYGESFPKTPYYIETARFNLIVPTTNWNGIQEVEAVVDYSRQYMAEGLEWKPTNKSRNISSELVIAWYEK